jgi:hypothetical protein
VRSVRERLPGIALATNSEISRLPFLGVLQTFFRDSLLLAQVHSKADVVAEPTASRD